MWKCQSCKAWSSNSRSLCFGCGSEQGGPATCSGACECSARCWIKYDTSAVTVYSVNACANRNRGTCEGQESAQETPATVNRQTRGSQRAAPGRRGARSGTGYHRSNQGSSAAERWSHVGGCSQKKAFAQLEESEKTLESKRKALQQAQEALEEASRKHAAAQEACASVEHEIEEEEDQDEEMHEEDQNNTRDPYRDWYNSSDCTSQSRELKEMRTAISQISDTLALLLKTLLPVAVEVGTTVKMPQTLALQTGVRVEETASCEGLTESRVPATPKQLPTVPEEEQDLLGTTPVGNSAEDVTNALNPFRSTSERHRPY